LNYDTPASYCPNIAASMETTRLKLVNNDHIWFDFSSWLRCGRSGLYVVGSVKVDECDLSYAELPRILDKEVINCVPSKYFACMKDVFPDSYKFAFSKDNYDEEMLSYNKIKRREDNSVYENIHKITTAEEFADELITNSL